jgi:hypothetical protein
MNLLCFNLYANVYELIIDAAVLLMYEYIEMTSAMYLSKLHLQIKVLPIIRGPNESITVCQETNTTKRAFKNVFMIKKVSTMSIYIAILNTIKE